MRAIGAATSVIFAVLLASGCGASGPKPSTQYTTPPETTAGLSVESPRVQQIALARSSNRLFSIFPTHPGTKKCGIPEGGVHFRPLPGTCTTRIRAAQTHEPELLVSFTETWSLAPPCPRGIECMLRQTQRHTWTVVETEPIVATSSRLRIAATRQSGPTPPQYYK